MIALSLLVAGVDEAGRGPLAGPVVASAVILPQTHLIEGLADSKTLSATHRDKLYEMINKYALAWSLGRAEVEEIDSYNILQASLLAMRRAVMQLTSEPELVLVDGNKSPDLPYKTKCIIRGDQTEPAISAASIMAKVSRDREMIELDKRYPEFGFARHKGYPTKAHIHALAKHGVSPIHRRSFGPVKKHLQEELR